MHVGRHHDMKAQTRVCVHRTCMLTNMHTRTHLHIHIYRRTFKCTRACAPGWEPWSWDAWTFLRRYEIMPCSLESYFQLSLQKIILNEGRYHSAVACIVWRRNMHSWKDFWVRKRISPICYFLHFLGENELVIAFAVNLSLRWRRAPTLSSLDKFMWAEERLHLAQRSGRFQGQCPKADLLVDLSIQQTIPMVF
jgi:hypothetical protein